MPNGQPARSPFARSSTRDSDAFLRDVLAGLTAAHKSLPCKYLYDAEGSRLFDAITELDEYYPTRTEAAILTEHAAKIARAVGPDARVIEYGSGSSVKTRLLLDALDTPASYVPLDISAEHLAASAERLQAEYPDLHVEPVVADYTASFRLPDVPGRRTLVFFPGSTIGNFDPDEAQAFLASMRDVIREDGAVLIGVDLKKSPDVLERAYDDREGVTAAFNRNLITRINRELDGTLDPSAFEHLAVWNAEQGRVEMHLVSTRDQVGKVAHVSIPFREGERIHTESSYKYSLPGFEQVAAQAGLGVDRVWTDADRRFSVQLLTAAED
jgi:dimethylhistidine N-methyltransferase